MIEKTKTFWSEATTKTRAAIVFVVIVLGFVGTFFGGNALLSSFWPANPDYHVARVTPYDATNVSVKKESASWHVEPTNAYNATKENLSVGQRVSVRQYWWFGQHTIVTEVTGR